MYHAYQHGQGSRLIDNSSRHCPYYNQGLFIGAVPSEKTQISMCCWQNKSAADTITFDHPYLENIREESRTAIPKSCSPHCSVPGHIANERERSLVEWNTLISTDTESKVIRSLHLEQSLLCNLKCISCSSRFSSSWNGEYQLFEPDAPQITLKKNPESVWQHLDLQHIKKLHFTGGEPLLNRDNKKILQHLDSLGVLPDLIVSYNTNGTVIPDAETLALWKRCRFVRLFFSLDGIGSTFEFTRFPAAWSEVQDNIQYFRSLKDTCILIEVNAIVGVHNIFNLPEFFQWWKDHCQTGSQGDPSQIFVRRIDPSSYGGTVLDLRHLTKNQALSAVDMLYSLSDYPGVHTILDYIKQNSQPDNCWVDYLDRLSELRKIDWRTALSPEIQKELTC